MKYIIYPFICLFLLVTACQSEVAPFTKEELFAEYQHAVVNIDAEYYYSARISDSAYVYFTDFDGEKILNLSLSVSELEGKMKKAQGNGFFIEQQGEIVTNRFVTGPSFKEYTLSKALESQLSSLIYSMKDKLNDIEADIEMMTTDLTYLSGKEAARMKSKLNATIARTKQIKSTGMMLALDPSKLIIRNEIYAAKITYPNSKQVDQAHMTATSTDRRVDLTILQLASKKTPAFVKKTFNLDENNPNVISGYTTKSFDPSQEMKSGTPLFALNVNNGKTEILEGSSTFISNKFRVIYSFNLGNGCPVFDHWGNLVAVNNNVIENDQPFNYGTISSRILDFANQ